MDKSDQLIILKNNRDKINAMTKRILEKESSPEVALVDGFIDTYIANFEKIGTNIGEQDTLSGDIPLSIGSVDLLSALLLPIIVNLITDYIEKKWNDRDAENVKRKEIEEILYKRLKNRKKAKRLAGEICEQFYDHSNSSTG
jgi:hypothetical protein